MRASAAAIASRLIGALRSGESAGAQAGRCVDARAAGGIRLKAIASSGDKAQELAVALS